MSDLEPSAARDYTSAQRTALRLIMAFRRADRSLAEHEGDAMRAHGLTPMQFGVLDTLAMAGGDGLHVGEIIERMVSTWGNMTVVIRNMERDGLVARRRDPTDARSFLISITEEGLARLNETLPDHALTIERLFSALSQDEQHQLTALLKKLDNHPVDRHAPRRR